MKKLLLILIIVIAGGAKQSQAQNCLWAKSAGEAGSDIGNSIATDASGNVLVAGYFQSSSITFGTTTLTNAGSNDMFIVKYDSSGNVLMAKSAGESDNDYGYSIATDASGNIIVTGSFQSSSITFGTTTLTNACAGNADVFIVKYDTSGNVLWAKSAGGTYTEVGYSIATDAIGNIIVSGSFTSSSITFGTTTLTNANSSSYSDIFIVKYDTSGNVLWAKSAGGTYTDFGNSVSTDAIGNILVTGFFQNDSITFGTTTLTNAGNNDIFLVKYDSSGNVLWAKSAGGTGNDWGNSVSTDAGGNILVTGWFVSPSITFGTTTLTNASGYDVFIFKYDSNGNALWAKNAGGTDDDFGYGVATDTNENILVTGYFQGSSITFGTTTLTNAGSFDMFIVKYDSSGDVLWAKGAGGAEKDWGISVSTDACGNTLVTGRFVSPSIAFGTTTLTNGGGWDMFVAKYEKDCVSAPAQPGAVSGNETVCSGSSNTYSITAVSGATSYTWTLPGGWSGTSTIDSITATAGTSGNITVTADNLCGSSVAQILNVTVNSAPEQPGAVSGNETVCSGSSNTYSIAAVSGATSYTWTLPGGWSGTSTTDSITATAGTSGNITVTANNVCGSSVAQILNVSVNSVPAQPGTISVNATVCSESSNTYSITAVSGATSYTWTLPGGWSGTSTTDSITATSGTSGNITVTANNGCGSSVAQILSVSVNSAPVQPGAISGNATVCYESSNTYSITAVSGATNYTWTLPGGWIGTSITENITATAGTSGNITVTADNDCGSSDAQILSVSVDSAPAQPGTINGNATICSGSSNTYSITAVSGATSYTWTLPGGWIGTSMNESITATAGTSGNITVTSNNDCGSSVAQILSVSVNAIDISVSVSGVTLTANATGSAYQWIDCNGNIPISGQTSQSFTATVTGNYAVIVNQNGCSDTSSCYNVTTVGIIENNPATPITIFPNPSNGKFTLEVTGNKGQEISLEIYNVLGEIIYAVSYFNQQTSNEIDLSEHPKGFYFVKIYDGEKNNTEKIVIQ